MTATSAVAAVTGVVLAVEVVMWTTSGPVTHLLPGGFTLFSAFGALVLVRVAKSLSAAGVQQPATDGDDE